MLQAQTLKVLFTIVTPRPHLLNAADLQSHSENFDLYLHRPAPYSGLHERLS